MSNKIEKLPFCAKCQKSVDMIEINRLPSMQVYRVTIYCHGKTEVITSDDLDIEIVFNNEGDL